MKAVRNNSLATKGKCVLSYNKQQDSISLLKIILKKGKFSKIKSYEFSKHLSSV